jgi:hypothetical protein
MRSTLHTTLYRYGFLFTQQRVFHAGEYAYNECKIKLIIVSLNLRRHAAFKIYEKDFCLVI